MAGASVAMGNARPAIKQIASRVIGTNAEHAVQGFQPVRVYHRAVLEVKPQTGDTVEHFFDVVFSADFFQNLVGQAIDIHTEFPFRL